MNPKVFNLKTLPGVISLGKQRAKGMAVIGRQCNNLTFYTKEHGISISRIYHSEIYPTLGEYMNPEEFNLKTLSSSPGHIPTGGTPKLPTLNIWGGYSPEQNWVFVYCFVL